MADDRRAASPGRCATATTPPSSPPSASEVAELCARFPAYPDGSAPGARARPSALRRRCDGSVGADRARRTRSDSVGSTGSCRRRVTTSSSVPSPRLATFVVTPLVGRLARRRGWLYEPNERTVHTTPIPASAGWRCSSGSSSRSRWPACSTASTRCSPATPSRTASLLAAIVIFAVGLFDDIKGISAPAKVTGTVVAGLVLVWFGVTMYYFRAAVRRRDRPVATTGSR